MSTLELKAYEIFKTKLGEDEDSTILQWVEEKSEKKITEKKDIFLTKDDKIDLIDRINKAKVETIIWIVGVGVLQFILSVIAKKYL